MKASKAVLTASGIVLVVSALAGAQAKVLPAGGKAIMSKKNMQIRRSLAIAPVSLPRPPSYRPVPKCSYRILSRNSRRQWVEHRQETSIRRVRNRLLVTVTEGPHVSTALIGEGGKVFDFNTAGPGGMRNTSDAFLRSSRGGSTDLVINPVNLAFPDYHRPGLSVGQSVAWVQHYSAWPWGYYVYRGTTTFKNKKAILLDLTTPADGKAPDDWPTVGFSIIDLENGLPLLYVLDAGFNIHAEQIGCQ